MATTYRMEPGQTYDSWLEFRRALDDHCNEHKVLFNIGHAKTVEQANGMLKKPPFFPKRLKYTSIIFKCKHFGSYKSQSVGMRPKQKSYKVNCKAFVSLSACRRNGYLIVRDSCHLHSHPCNDDIYRTYPEVRRMSVSEKKMVLSMMEMGMPISRIKGAVGHSVTHKDLHNVKLQLARMEEDGSSPRGTKRRHDGGREEEEGSLAKRGSMLEEEEEGVVETMTELGDHLKAAVDSGDKGDERVSEDHLSDLLAAAGVSSDSVVLTVNQGAGGAVKVEEEEAEPEESPKNSYTVTISLPDGDVTHTGTNLQELLKGLPLHKIETAKSSALSRPQTSDGVSIPKGVKTCEKCETYVSPLDGHSLCLQCLGPEHLNDDFCVHCQVMKPQQLNIRRKQLVRTRMKKLKEVQEKRLARVHTREGMSDSEESSSSSSVFAVRKSRRMRKAKVFGPEYVVSGSPQETGAKSVSSLLPLKTEPLEEGDLDPLEAPGNTERFDHLVRQSVALGDVSVEEGGDGILRYIPDQTISQHFGQIMAHREGQLVAPTSSHISGRYSLHHKFEADFCGELLPPPTSNPSHPSPLLLPSPSAKAVSHGLRKLATNAAVQTRLAVYDQLFTRLGVGMADDALTILAQLYGRVSNATEISQDDLTSSLQTALDTVQALKDLLQELGVVSQDSVTTAAHQRCLTVQSYDMVKRCQQQQQAGPSPTPGGGRGGRFKPFTATKLSVTKPPCTDNAIIPPPPPLHVSPDLCPATPDRMPHFIKQLVELSTSTGADMVTSEGSNLALQVGGMTSNLTLPVGGTDTGQETTVEEAATTATTFFNVSSKEYTVSPIAVNFPGGPAKDSVIELHVMKEDGADLLPTGQSTEIGVLSTGQSTEIEVLPTGQSAGIEEAIHGQVTTVTAEELMAGHSYQLTG